ncbi:hypothetical protein DS906_04650 [Ruegeria sp. A3M17]|nr:hypothetical protein DS906_04650 [Ruegeria sp. A3M17]
MAQSEDETQEKPKVLFVQHADEATLSDGTLTLNGTGNHMIVFADRPLRAASVVPTEKLIDAWNEGKDSFAEDPPNAAVIGEVDGKATSLIVEITNPQLTDSNLTFDYTLLEGPDSLTLEKSYIIIDDSVFADMNLLVGIMTNNSGEVAASQEAAYPDSEISTD